MDVPMRTEVSSETNFEASQNFYKLFSNTFVPIDIGFFSMKRLRWIEMIFYESRRFMEPKAGLLNKRLWLTAALGVTKFIDIIATNSVTLCCTT